MVNALNLTFSRRLVHVSHAKTEGSVFLITSAESINVYVPLATKGTLVSN